MLDPVTFEINGFEFTYTPLQITPARELLYDEITPKFGQVIGEFIKAFNLAKEINLDSDVSALVNSVTASIGSGICELSLVVDGKWLSRVLKDKLFPNLIVKIENRTLPMNREAALAWYETSMNCSSELKLFFKMLRVQYEDFLGLWESLSTLIGTLQKNSSNLDFLKELTGK